MLGRPGQRALRAEGSGLGLFSGTTEPLDRAQKLVIIGQNVDEADLRARLDACLLDEELAGAGHERWAELPNPFPSLQVGAEAP